MAPSTLEVTLNCDCMGDKQVKVGLIEPRLPMLPEQALTAIDETVPAN